MTSGVSTFFHFDICPFFTCLHLSRIYTGGCYYFNKTTEEWEGVGLSVEEGVLKISSLEDIKVYAEVVNQPLILYYLRWIQHLLLL